MAPLRGPAGHPGIAPGKGFVCPQKQLRVGHVHPQEHSGGSRRGRSGTGTPRIGYGSSRRPPACRPGHTGLRRGEPRRNLPGTDGTLGGSGPGASTNQRSDTPGNVHAERAASGENYFKETGENARLSAPAETRSRHDLVLSNICPGNTVSSGNSSGWPEPRLTCVCVLEHRVRVPAGPVCRCQEVCSGRDGEPSLRGHPAPRQRGREAVASAVCPSVLFF